jgi:hypothetical protein
LLAHAIITRQHSGGGTKLAEAYVTRQHKCTKLVGCAGGYLMSPASIVPLQNQQSLFKAVKHCQIKKL